MPVIDAELIHEHDTNYHELCKTKDAMHAFVLEALPLWERDPLQSNESWLEQNECYDLLADRTVAVVGSSAVDKDVPRVRPVYLSGPPGCGKTFVALHIAKLIQEMTVLRGRYCAVRSTFLRESRLWPDTRTASCANRFAYQGSPFVHLSSVLGVPGN